MLTFSLQSGSCGNCYYYESRGVKLLFDAGIPWRCAAERMAEYGVSPEKWDGLFISHDHSDHTSCAGVFQRKMKAPIFCTVLTHRCMEHRLGKIALGGIEHFCIGEVIKVGPIKVITIPTPHDAADPCAFIVDDGETRVGIMTDLGHCFPALKSCLETLDVIFLESNYDQQMLQQNPFYPEHLKSRIRGGRGHLENTESAKLIRDNTEGRLQVLLLSHLSQDNNCPDVAMKTHQAFLGRRNHLQVHVAPRHTVSPAIDSSMLAKRGPRTHGQRVQLSLF